MSFAGTLQSFTAEMVFNHFQDMISSDVHKVISTLCANGLVKRSKKNANLFRVCFPPLEKDIDGTMRPVKFVGENFEPLDFGLNYAKTALDKQKKKNSVSNEHNFTPLQNKSPKYIGVPMYGAATINHKMVLEYIRDNPGVCINCISENFTDFCVVPIVLDLVNDKIITVTKDGVYSIVKPTNSNNAKSKQDNSTIVLVDDNGVPLDFSGLSKNDNDIKTDDEGVWLDEKTCKEFKELKARFYNKHGVKLTTLQLLESIVSFALKEMK